MEPIKNTLLKKTLPNDFGSLQNGKTTNDSPTAPKPSNYDATAQLGAILEALPPRYQNLKPDYELYERLKTRSLLLTGAVGSGKTRKLLEVIVAHLMETYKARHWDFFDEGFIPVDRKTVEGLFLSVPMVLFTLKEEFDKSHTGASFINKMISAPVLFLDDLGAEKASEWVKEQLYIVINERYNWCKPVLLTTNLTVKEIAEHYGDRMASRLVEMCETINYGGTDKRLENRKQA